MGKTKFFFPPLSPNHQAHVPGGNYYAQVLVHMPESPWASKSRAKSRGEGLINLVNAAGTADPLYEK